MKVPTKRPPFRVLFRGSLVWAGLILALGGYLAEEFTGGVHAFETFLLFGGINIGLGAERNRQEYLRQQEE